MRSGRRSPPVRGRLREGQPAAAGRSRAQSVADLRHERAVRLRKHDAVFRLEGRTASEPMGGSASGRDPKISRRAANSAGSQTSVFMLVIMRDAKETAWPGAGEQAGPLSTVAPSRGPSDRPAGPVRSRAPLAHSLAGPVGASFV
jgi:hypothetical protein